MFVSSLKQAIEDRPVATTADTSIDKVISMMSQSRASCVLVVEENTVGTGDTVSLGGEEKASVSPIIGIFTERDVVRLIASHSSLKDLKVAEAMSQPVIVFRESPTDEQDIITVLNLLRRYRIRHLPVLNQSGVLVGLITQQSIRSVLQPIDFMRLRRVGEVMNRRVIHAPTNTSVLHLAKLMAIYHVSSVVLAEPLKSALAEPLEATFESWSDDSCKLKPVTPVGIVTERDIVQFLNLGLNLETLQAETVMSAPLFPIKPWDSLWEAHQQMQRLRVQRLVVAGDRGELAGIITQTSLLQALDPIEMYAEIEVLQQLLQQSESEREALLAQLMARNKLLESLALTDQLTGLPNRRAMDQALMQILRSSTSEGVWLFMLDVDYFKRVNDTYGHPTGDHLLKEIADRLGAVTRSDSWLYRYGGEEFVCIATGLSVEAAWDYGECLRQAIAELPFQMSPKLALPITISIGGATISAGNAAEKQALLDLADRALYEAKRCGRNCIRLLSEPMNN
ncbi:MAG: hypothetical protein Fur0025_33990 [Oscillatoriaceae cyanobacterium]